MASPDDRKYSRHHEWVKTAGASSVRIGITQFEANQLGDLALVELPKVGDKFAADEQVGSIESMINAVHQLDTPVGGTVTAVKADAEADPETITNDPWGTWLVEIAVTYKSALDHLLSAAEYDAYVAGETS